MQKKCRFFWSFQKKAVLLHAFLPRQGEKSTAQVAELVDALVSNTNGKPCRFDPGPGYRSGGRLKHPLSTQNGLNARRVTRRRCMQ